VTGRLLPIACAVIFCASAVAPQNQPGLKVHAAKPLLYTTTSEYQPLAWLHGADRFPKGATVVLKTSLTTKPLAAGFLASADANVSFDAKTVLFSGKQYATDHWQVWEIALPAGLLRQVTHCDDDCVRPLHVPSNRVVYAHRIENKFALEIASLNGTDAPLPLTHAPGNFLPSDVLQDGRILFETGYPVESAKVSELYTGYTDGSGVEAYRCDHGHSRHSGKQMSSGDVVFARDGKLFRFTSALAHEVSVPAPRGAYAGDVAEVQSGTWLVSSRATNAKFFELHTWKPGTTNLLPLISVAGKNILQPVLLAERTVPNHHPSALHEWTYANVLCLNAYTSKDHLPDGSIASVRLYTRDVRGATQVQGTAQVEKDGSFYLRVPGDQPIKIELLDGEGKTVKSEAGWFWLRGGEQRICTGCHAGPERAPENALPAVLLRSTEAADLTTPMKTQAPAAGGH
jgi:hydrazine synthase alpha subunit-like protein